MHTVHMVHLPILTFSDGSKIMGILSKILAGESAEKITTGNPEQKTAAVSSPPQPTGPIAPCEKCSSGIFWLDSYGTWHCESCQPPRAEAMVRQLRMTNPTGGPDQNPAAEKSTDQKSFADIFQITPGFTVQAVRFADGAVVFSPALTAAGRRDAMNAFCWPDFNSKTQTERTKP